MRLTEEPCKKMPTAEAAATELGDGEGGPEPSTARRGLRSRDGLAVSTRLEGADTTAEAGLEATWPPPTSKASIMPVSTSEGSVMFVVVFFWRRRRLLRAEGEEAGGAERSHGRARQRFRGTQQACRCDKACGSTQARSGMRRQGRGPCSLQARGQLRRHRCLRRARAMSANSTTGHREAARWLNFNCFSALPWPQPL